MLALLRSSGRLCTPSNELKLWTPWWRPYMPFWCYNTDRTNLKASVKCKSSPQTESCVTCGSPVRMAERLGEQLLTDVKALLNTKLRWARARRWGVWTTELLYTSVSKPASSAGQSDVQKDSTLLRVICKFFNNTRHQNNTIRTPTRTKTATKQNSEITGFFLFYFKCSCSREQPL